MNQDLKIFDGIKAICTFIVVFGHVGRKNMHIAKNHVFYTFYTQGAAHQTQDAFLFISGWLSAMSFINSLNKKGFGSAYYDFFLRRLFRLAPLYYLIMFLNPDYSTCSWKEFYSYITFTHTYFKEEKKLVLQTFWFVQTSIHLFAITPIVVYLTMKVHDILKVILYIGFSAYIVSINPDTLSFNSEHRCVPFFIGILSYLLNQKLQLGSRISKFVMNLMLVMFPFCIHYVCKNNYNYKTAIFLPWLVVFCVSCVQNGKDSWPNRVSNWRILQIINRFSYEFYMIEMFVLFKLDAFEYLKENYNYQIKHINQMWQFSIALTLVMIPISYILEQYVEKPIGITIMKIEQKARTYVLANPQTAIKLFFGILAFASILLLAQQPSTLKSCKNKEIIDESLFRDQMKPFELDILNQFKYLRLDDAIDRDDGIVLQQLDCNIVRKQNTTAFNYDFNEITQTLDIFGEFLYFRGKGFLGLLQGNNTHLEAIPFQFQGRIQDYQITYKPQQTENGTYEMVFDKFESKLSIKSEFKKENKVRHSTVEAVNQKIQKLALKRINQNLVEQSFFEPCKANSTLTVQVMTNIQDMMKQSRLMLINSDSIEICLDENLMTNNKRNIKEDY